MATLEPNSAESHAQLPVPLDTRATLPTRTVLEGAGAPLVLTSAPSPAALLQALRRCWLPAITVGLVCAGTVAWLIWFYIAPSRFVAAALLHVDATPPRVLFNTADNSRDSSSYQRTQAALIKSRFVLNAALRQPEVANLGIVREQPAPLDWLAKELVVDFTLSPELLRLSMRGERKEELTTLVNAVANAYLEEVVNKEHNTRQAQLDRLKEIYSQYDDKLRGRRRTLRELAESAGSADQKTLSLKQRYALEQLASAQKELMQLQAEGRKLHMQISTQAAQAKRLGEIPVPTSYLDEILKKDKASEQYLARKLYLTDMIDRTQRVAARGQAEALSAGFRAELASLEASLAARRKELEPLAGKQYREARQEQLLTNQNALQDQLGALKELEKQLTADINRLSDETRFINKSSLDLDSIKDEIALSENVSKGVGAEIERLKVELLAPPRVRFIEAAEAPSSLDDRRRLMMTAGAALAALSLVLGGFAFGEFRSRKVHTSDQIVQGLGLRLVGEVPTLPLIGMDTANGDDSSNGYAHCLWNESIDTMRTLLLHGPSAESIRAVLVTSALPGEGKTTLACHLAQSLARSGRRTLLVDCDLRKPTAHRLFGIPCENGLSEVLDGTAMLGEAIRSTDHRNLWVLPAGRAKRTTTHTLAHASTQSLFERLKAEYDFVILDSPPVLAVADSLLIARHADGAVLSTLRSISRLPTLYAAHERLTALGARVLGVVVGGMRGKAYERRYYRSYLETLSTGDSTGEEAQR